MSEETKDTCVCSECGHEYNRLQNFVRKLNERKNTNHDNRWHFSVRVLNEMMVRVHGEHYERVTRDSHGCMSVNDYCDLYNK